MSARSARGPKANEVASVALGDLLSSLAVIDVICAPRGLDVAVTEAVIYDSAAPPPIEPGSFVLGVGVAAADAPGLIGDAGVAEASGLALKLADGDADGPLRAAADDAGVALLCLPHEMTWSQAHTLIRTALAIGRPSGDEMGAPLGDLFALANAFAAMVGGAVTIEDRHSRVLAYSSHGDDVDEPRRQTILGRRVPDEWLARLEAAGVFRRLWAGEVVRYEADPQLDLRPRLALAVRAGDTILGSLWVAEGDKPLGPRAKDALHEAARIAALHMIRHRSASDLDRNLRADALRALLDGQGSIDGIAYRLGVPANGTFAVLAFDPVSREEVEDALAFERVLDLVTLYGEAFRQRSAVVHLGQTIYVLLPGADAYKPERIVAIAGDIVERASSSARIGLRAGVGSTVTHLRNVPGSRREADQVLRALASDGAVNVADFEAARSRVALVELRDFVADHPHVRSSKLRRLVEHDAAHGTGYTETLKQFLDALGDIPAAARRGNVHPNTFRYRLRRLVEVGGIDLGDPDERLLLALDLRTGGDSHR